MDMVVLGFKPLEIFAFGLIVVPLVQALRICGIRVLGWMALGVQGLGCFLGFLGFRFMVFWGSLWFLGAYSRVLGVRE